jgi:hypothetical protein
MKTNNTQKNACYNNRIQKCLLKFNFNVIWRFFFYFCINILYFLIFHLIFRNLILILYFLSLFNNKIFKYILIAFNFLKCNSSIDLSSIKIWIFQSLLLPTLGSKDVSGWRGKFSKYFLQSSTIMNRSIDA